jgi:hypothetical protein
VLLHRGVALNKLSADVRSLAHSRLSPHASRGPAAAQEGRTALQHAAAFGHTACVAALLERGADGRVRDKARARASVALFGCIDCADTARYVCCAGGSDAAEACGERGDPCAAARRARCRRLLTGQCVSPVSGRVARPVAPRFCSSAACAALRRGRGRAARGSDEQQRRSLHVWRPLGRKPPPSLPRRVRVALRQRREAASRPRAAASRRRAPSRRCRACASRARCRAAAPSPARCRRLSPRVCGHSAPMRRRRTWCVAPVRAHAPPQG